MPRHARYLSNSGYYHLIVRGIGRQVLFEEEADYRFYLSLLKRYSEETNVFVCAYCLMENHVHLLVHDITGLTPLFMKKLGVCYSGYFNKKYDRCGHLFQDRYLSENIDSTDYLLTVFRYILNNPEKAGICSAEVYPWSSYIMYENSTSFPSTSIFHTLIGDYDQFISFMKTENNDDCMEYEATRTDSWARDKMRELLNIESGTVLQKWSRSDRNTALSQLKEAGLSIRQIERLTGISRNIIQRA